jgi:hypothetical protein
MRLAWGALALACLLAGLLLTLRTLGLVEVVLHGAGHWWPALLVAVGVAILLRSVKPAPNIVVAVGLMVAGCIAFAVTNVVMPERVWILVAAGWLILAGLIFTCMAARTRPHDTGRLTKRISVLFRAAEVTPESAELQQVKVFLFCSYLKLDLSKILSPTQLRNAPLMIEITAWIGNVELLVPPEVEWFDHKAFVLRIRNRVPPKVLGAEDISTAQVVAATLAFFGDAEFKKMPSSADSGAAGSGSGLDHLRPASY